MIDSPHTTATRSLIGACYAPEPGPSRCAVCGPSPYASGRPTKAVLGPNFTDYDLLTDASAPDVCGGCAAMLGGKPGSVPMPLRMGHFAVVDGELLRPGIAELVELIYSPPAEIQAIAWTATRKRHASLRCGPCSPDHLMIGTETGTVAWDVAEGRTLIDAVAALRASASQEVILTGQYPPHVVLALGAAWEPAEAVVSRYRPSPTLELAVALARRPESTDTPEAAMPISEPYRRAADLVLCVGQSSTVREGDPIAFWAHLLARRLTSAAQRPTLLAMVGRLAQDIRAQPSLMADAVAMIEDMTEEQAAEVLRLCRDTPLLVIAFARQISRERYEERS